MSYVYLLRVSEIFIVIDKNIAWNTYLLLKNAFCMLRPWHSSTDNLFTYKTTIKLSKFTYLKIHELSDWWKINGNIVCIEPGSINLLKSVSQN
jgi:hypothetical protein